MTTLEDYTLAKFEEPMHPAIKLPYAYCLQRLAARMKVPVTDPAVRVTLYGLLLEQANYAVAMIRAAFDGPVATRNLYQELCDIEHVEENPSTEFLKNWLMSNLVNPPATAARDFSRLLCGDDDDAASIGTPRRLIGIFLSFTHHCVGLQTNKIPKDATPVARREKMKEITDSLARSLSSDTASPEQQQALLAAAKFRRLLAQTSA